MSWVSSNDAAPIRIWATVESVSTVKVRTEVLMSRVVAMIVFTLFISVGTQSYVTAEKAGNETTGLHLPDEFTAVMGSFVGGVTAPVKGSDGRWHVVYELWMTNGKQVPASIKTIEVLDYDDRTKVLASFEGGELDISQLSTLPREDADLQPNESLLVYVDLAFHSETDVPDAIVHRFIGTGASNPGSRQPADLSYLFAPWDLSRKKSPIIAAPVAGQNWVAINGCCRREGAHRGSVQTVNGTLFDSQRFAIDWMRLNEQNRLVQGTPSEVSSWICYDEPIYAIADGVVVEALDGLADQIPGALPDPNEITLQTIDGNHIILDLGNGVFAFYAHLKKGSIIVKEGDKVKVGQQIGRLGNSGNTSAPHLHLHLMTGPSALGADGIPYVFEKFSVRGAIDPDQWRETGEDITGKWKVVALDNPGPHKNELPLDLRVVDFPEISNSRD